MTQESPIVNRVAQSGLITLDLADLLPAEALVQFDLKPLLVQETVLMEKPFRESLKQIDWSAYAGKVVAVDCSVDTLIPKWAYMLVSSYLSEHAKAIYCSTVIEAENSMLLQNIQQLDLAHYQDARVVIKGCGQRDIPAEAYLAITQKLQPVVKSLMYGEPCSTVPVYKSKKG